MTKNLGPGVIGGTRGLEDLLAERDRALHSCGQLRVLEHFPYYCGLSNRCHVGLFLRKRPAERVSLVYTYTENALGVESQEVVPIQAGAGSGRVEV